MKRILTAIALSAGFLLTGAAQTVQAATAYNFFDLSPSIPHKSGALFQGIWNDGSSWVVTNGTDALLVDGKSFAVANVASRLQSVGMFQPLVAAGTNGTWVVAGSRNGVAGSYSSDFVKSDSLEFVELTAAGQRIIPTPWTTPTQTYLRPALFRAGGQIYMVANPDTQPKLYAYQNGGFVETAIPAWVLARNTSFTLDYNDFQDTDAAYFYDGYSNQNEPWIVFDGSWHTSASPSVASASVYAYAAARGTITGSSFATRGLIHPAYGIVNGRDALDHASRRADGTALLSGYGANGLRLILATPINNPVTDEDELGTVILTATRVAGSTSRYALTAHATGPVTFVRILKNGIGIAKCSASTCNLTVDVKSTSDRYEAWATSAHDIGRPLTSKAINLRDTAAISEYIWMPNSNSWTWTQPSSFSHQPNERVSWHVGSFMTTSVKQSVCDIPDPYWKGHMVCRFKADTAGVNRALTDVGSLKAEIFVEGKLTTTCTIPKDTADKERTIMRTSITSMYFGGQARIDDCATSFTQSDAPTIPVTVNYGYGDYTVMQSLGTVRVYAKISWTDQGKKRVIVTPTDTVSFKTY